MVMLADLALETSLMLGARGTRVPIRFCKPQVVSAPPARMTKVSRPDQMRVSQGGVD